METKLRTANGKKPSKLWKETSYRYPKTISFVWPLVSKLQTTTAPTSTMTLTYPTNLLFTFKNPKTLKKIISLTQSAFPTKRLFSLPTHHHVVT